MVTITEPGIYEMPADDYHADPVEGGSLSRSGAKSLLPPSCPAKFKHEREHGRPDKDEFDFGHAAHRVVLGDDTERVTIIEADNWRTKAAREARDEARAAGVVPILADDWATVEKMAAQIKAHPLASRLLNGGGKCEQSAFWQDAETGIWRRCRFDWLPDPAGRSRFIVTDYKTARSAEPAAFARTCPDYGYDMQAVWYMDAVRALGIDDDPHFLFIVQEKTPPYVVSVVGLDADSLRVGRERCRKAIDIYVECTRTGRWPGYSDDVEYVSLPFWFINQHDYDKDAA